MPERMPCLRLMRGDDEGMAGAYAVRKRGPTAPEGTLAVIGIGL
jgi:hypothetical protein